MFWTIVGALLFVAALPLLIILLFYIFAFIIGYFRYIFLTILSLLTPIYIAQGLFSNRWEGLVWASFWWIAYFIIKKIRSKKGHLPHSQILEKL